MIFFILASFGITSALLKTKIPTKIVFTLMHITKGNAKLTVLMFMIATAVISAFVSNLPCTALFAGIAMSSIIEVEQKNGTAKHAANLGKALMIGIAYASCMGGMITPAGSALNIMTLNMLGANAGFTISFLDWVIICAPIALILLVVDVYKRQALALATKNPYDLFVLDIMLPGMDGYELCRRLRSKTTVPVLFLSARDTELDKVVGLEIGGDDYLAKPFGVRELIARVRALLRRGSGGDFPGANHAITASGITLDEDAHTASGEHGEIDLTPREFELLASLMKNAGKVVSREDLLRDAWGWEYLTETKTVDTHIKRLRDKIEGAGYDPGLVETVRGYGYRFRQ